MRRTRRRSDILTGGRILGVALVLLGPVLVLAGDKSPAATASRSVLWQKSAELVAEGEFSGATDAIRQIAPGSELVGEVRAWLEEYEAKQIKRRALDREDFDKFVGYAKARIERKEYAKALDHVFRAKEVAEDRDALLESDWLLQLVGKALEKADELRGKHEWREAWYLYAGLGAIYEQEPRYRKLGSEVLTHLRLDANFDEKSHWEEKVARTQWRDAEYALELVGLVYVEKPDFRAITEHGLEQLLLLSESKTAQETFEGLGNADDRNDFRARVQRHLDQVRVAASVDRRDCVRRFRRVVKKINAETVRLPEELIVNELMRGALKPLDDFTSIIWPSETDVFDKHTRGSFVGVGISIVKNRADEVEVVTPLEDTPAYFAGVQAGDVITDVDGQPLKGFSINKVVTTITGPKDTPVTLTIRRGKESLEFPLVRRKVKIQSVKGWNRKLDGTWDYWSDKDNGIGYIRIVNFARNTVEDVRNVMSELQPNGLKALILDLRRNPGGLLDAAWQMSSLFLKRGEGVVSTRGRNRAEDQQFVVTSDGPYRDVPLVVLVDRNSASASEIVSGAIRDNHRGVVIGERTFGKFSVQNLISLSSSEAKLKITTARYYLPSGASLHREPTSTTWGVDPDIVVPLRYWERVNLGRRWRDANLLGPRKPESKKDDDKATAAKDDKEKDAKGEEGGEKLATAEDEKDKLPPLDQPDENNRAEDDPQVDTALLLLRVKLRVDDRLTLAAAEQQQAAKEANRSTRFHRTHVD